MGDTSSGVYYAILDAAFSGVHFTSLYTFASSPPFENINAYMGSLHGTEGQWFMTNLCGILFA